MQIGLISDTHGYLDPRVFEAFQDCDEIWHAGDFGDLDISKQLSAFKPLRAVYGNIDGTDVRAVHPLDLEFEVAGVQVLMSHIVGRPGRYNRRIKSILDRKAPDLLICGHSHLLHLEQDRKYNSMQFVNPGAAGFYGQQIERTLLKMELEAGMIFNFRVIELKPRYQRQAVDNDEIGL